MKYAIDRLRNKALRLLRENHALGFVISPPDQDGLRAIQSNKERIEGANKAQLQSYIQKVSSHIRERRTEYGVRASREQLIAFLEKAEAAPPGQFYLPTVAELREFFQDYARVWPDSRLMPAHARIFFDAHGRETFGNVRILEATIYEDMAALWNLLHDRKGLNLDICTPKERKTYYALCRSTVTAAVYFVEAYLNGLAFDYSTDHSTSLTEEEKGILSDFDFSKNRSRYLSLRDKFIKYQRIILQETHAPLQPNNFQPLKRLLEISESIRSPLAHPAPHKEIEIYWVKIETASDAVDSAIASVIRLESLIRGDLRRVLWLLKRSDGGEFSEKVFD